jgi:ribosomal protein L11 methyltransferase
MEWIAAKVVIQSGAKPQVIELITDIFYDLGVKGVQIEDPRLDPEEGWGADAVPKPLQDAVIGYFADTHQALNKLKMLQARIEALEKTQKFQCTLSSQRMEEADWAESWKTFFWPESITAHITVKPTWRDYTPKSKEIVLEIDPGMAFGTGTHPTTALCIGLMEKYVSKGCHFLDIGTGSGILMIAAAKLGAGELVGIDNDAMAVNIATTNLKQNQIRSRYFQVSVGNLLDDLEGKFDLIVANILSAPILSLLNTIDQHMTPKAVFICSGIYQDNQAAVAEKMQLKGLKLIETHVKDEWVAMACRKERLPV